MIETFEQFLQDRHIETEPAVLDDDLPDAFNDWLTRLDVDEWLEYGQEYAKSILPKVEEKILDKIM